MTTQLLRHKVLYLYKELLYMGRDYPRGYVYFRDKLHSSFSKKANLEADKDIEKALAQGAFVKKELEALYFLIRYRAMKKRYYD